MHTIATLKKGEKGIIQEFDIDVIPVQYAPFHDPLYININDSFVAIRKETAVHISIKKVS